MSDFDRIFDPEYSATDLFTDRAAEYEVFERALARHADHVLAGEATLDAAVRRNVMAFYGVGGIGKTELSRRLARTLGARRAGPAWRVGRTTAI